MLALLLLASTTFTGELWERGKPWYQKSLEHPFLTGLTDGSLPRDRFQFYLTQDALYLRDFAQALKFLSTKAPKPEWGATLDRHAKDAIAVERSMHESILRKFGVSKQAMARAKMAPVNRDYTAHLIQAVEEGSFAEGLSALLPCYWIYWEVGKELEKRGSKNPEYQRWINQYASEEYGKTVREVLVMMDEAAPKMGESERTRALELFEKSSQFEWMFWDMAWRMEKDASASVPAQVDIAALGREVASEHTQALPDFFCEQITSRYTSDNRLVEWRLQDRVTADVSYLNGKESYENIQLNGRKLRRGSPDRSGTWSTGEFGTLQRDILSTATAARFVQRGMETIAGRPAYVFDYTVERPNSHWRVTFENSTLYPAYQGSIWFDEETLRVVRIEMQARQIPASYPMDKMEMTLDYGWFRIGGADFLLPARAENLACIRSTYSCVRNETEFRGYRRFATESIVTTADSALKY